MSRLIEFMSDVYDSEERAAIFETALTKAFTKEGAEAHIILRAFGHRAEVVEGVFTFSMGDGRLVPSLRQMASRSAQSPAHPLPRRAAPTKARRPRDAVRLAGAHAATDGPGDHDAEVIPFPQARIVRVQSH